MESGAKGDKDRVRPAGRGSAGREWGLRAEETAQYGLGCGAAGLHDEDFLLEPGSGEDDEDLNVEAAGQAGSWVRGRLGGQERPAGARDVGRSWGSDTRAGLVGRGLRRPPGVQRAQDPLPDPVEEGEVHLDYIGEIRRKVLASASSSGSEEGDRLEDSELVWMGPRGHEVVRGGSAEPGPPQQAEGVLATGGDPPAGGEGIAGQLEQPG